MIRRGLIQTGPWVFVGLEERSAAARIMGL